MPAQPSDSPPLRVAVIGAGLSGLSAALHLLKHGHTVTVYEAAPQAGGRARAIKHPQTTLDNGQHLCIGAYHATQTLLQEAGVSMDAAFLRLPLALHMHDGAKRMSLVTPHWLPAPLHLLAGLLFARGLGWDSKWQALHWMVGLRLCGFRIRNDCSVRQLLAAGRQSRQAIRLLWEPLCLAALNTPIDTASAQVFLKVLADSFARRRADSDFLIPRHDLSTTLVTPLLKHVAALGGVVRLGCTVKQIQSDNRLLIVHHSDGVAMVDRVIVAVGPHQRKTLGLANVPGMTYQPITTVYLQFEPHVKLPYPVLGLCDGLAQWVFDRGQCCQQAGLLAVVISAHAPLPDKTDLLAACLQALNLALTAYQMHLPPQPRWFKVVTEKRATFACEAGMSRPPTETDTAGVYMAGDDIRNDYPATIEGTIRNGLQAADAAMRQLVNQS